MQRKVDVNNESTFSCVIGFNCSVMQLYHSVSNRESEACPALMIISIYRHAMKR